MDTHYPSAGKGYDDEPDELNEHWEEPGDPDGVVAADEERKWRQSHPVSALTPDGKPIVPRRTHRLPVTALMIVTVLIAAVVSYWLGTHHGDMPTKQQAKTAQSGQQNKQTAAADLPTKHYDSVTYTLGFDYPSNWIVSDTAAKLTVTSPPVSMKTTDGTVDGHVVVTIQNQQTSIPGYPSGGGMAGMSSDKLTYKQPSSVQRAQTYLSYIAYTSPNGIDALFLTGDSGYEQGQQIPMGDVVKGNPLVNVTFIKCSSDSCLNGTPQPLTLLASSWKGASFKPQIINLLQSLAIN